MANARVVAVISVIDNDGHSREVREMERASSPSGVPLAALERYFELDDGTRLEALMGGIQFFEPKTKKYFRTL